LCYCTLSTTTAVSPDAELSSGIESITEEVSQFTSSSPDLEFPHEIAENKITASTVAILNKLFIVRSF